MPTTLPSDVIATVAETVPGFAAMGWFALMTPTGTPDTIVRKVNADLNAVLELPAIKQRFQEIGTYPRPMSPNEATEFIRAEQALWRPIVRQMGVEQR